MSDFQVLRGDCRDLLKDLPDASVHAIVTDPPYGLSSEPKVEAVLSAWLAGREFERPGAKGFCGEEWDGFVPGPSVWKEVYRVLIPGGHLLSFGGTRTWDWLSVAMRLSGFQNRDTIADFFGPSALSWVYGQGMGKGSRLKPGWEPVLVFRKPTPLSDTAQEELTGTGKLNIRDCMLARDPNDESGWHKSGANGTNGYNGSDSFKIRAMGAEEIKERCGAARYPPNVLLTEGAAYEMDRQSGDAKGSGIYRAVDHGRAAMGVTNFGGRGTPSTMYSDSGGASRFFPCFRYEAKPTLEEREAGCEEAGLPVRVLNRVNPGGLEREPRFAPVERRNNHKTVKPIKLMRWLVRLVAKPGQLVLDPFAGSGTTGCAAVLEGRHFLGMELEQESWEIACARVAYWEKQATQQCSLFETD